MSVLEADQRRTGFVEGFLAEGKKQIGGQKDHSELFQSSSGLPGGHPANGNIKAKWSGDHPIPGMGPDLQQAWWSDLQQA